MTSSKSPLWQDCYRRKLIDPETLHERIKELKADNRTIATLNGSFDLLHAGHLQIVYEASLVADTLIVALNTDRSIKGYKGPDRPLIPLQYRLSMMAALEFVDFVTFFDEPDPRKILEIIRPDIHVNGSEYGTDCIEAETVRKHGGEIRIVQRIPGLATSDIIDKIKEMKH